MSPTSSLPDWIAPPPADAPRRLLVGFSGGLDSTVLLHRLVAEYGPGRVRAVHVDHGLQPAASAWAEHCARVCAGLGVGLLVTRVRVDRDGPLGLEGSARAARRAAFAEGLCADEVLTLAHHRDDQAETFLLRALRASGTDGLAAMRPWRPFAAGWLWRPLLNTPRAALLALAKAQGLRWIEDPSNAETDRDRNFLRHRVLPVLRERWAHADAAFARAAALSAESAELLQHEDNALLPRLTLENGEGLSVPALRSLPAPRRARILRHWVSIATEMASDGRHSPSSTGHAPLSAEGVARIERELLGDDHATEAAFAWAGWRIRRWRDGVYLLRQDGCGGAGIDDGLADADWRLEWDGRTPLTLPDGGALALDGVAGFERTLQVRPRRGGERILLPGRRHRHSLKHVLQAMQVPPWTRARLPLLFDRDGALLAAGDRILAAPFADWLAARDARLRWRPSALPC